MHLVIHPDNSADIAEQAAYYAIGGAGLAQAFLDEIDTGIAMIMTHAQGFSGTPSQFADIRTVEIWVLRALSHPEPEIADTFGRVTMNVMKSTGRATNE